MVELETGWDRTPQQLVSEAVSRDEPPLNPEPTVPCAILGGPPRPAAMLIACNELRKEPAYCSAHLYDSALTGSSSAANASRGDGM